MAKRSYKLVMEDGSEQIIRTEMSMFELGNELRSKAKISTENLTGSTINIRCADVHSIEHYRVSPEKANHTKGKEK